MIRIIKISINKKHIPQKEDIIIELSELDRFRESLKDDKKDRIYFTYKEIESFS